MKACFSQPRLDLIKISKDTESGVIEARWRARGRPRTPWNKQEKYVHSIRTLYSFVHTHTHSLSLLQNIH